MENIDIDKIKTIYFLGIGGIGMSALAQYFLHCGKQVHGYDLTANHITENLKENGAILHFEEDVNKIPSSVDFVVHTPSVPIEHAEYQYFIKNNIPIYKRAELLGQLTCKFFNIAVAGTHGKTTTTAMLSHILYHEKKIMAFIGGVAKNFDSNVVLDDKVEWAIAEADEFDRSFLQLTPDAAVITSIDADHLDIYNTKENLEENFKLFVQQVRNGGPLILHEKIYDNIDYFPKLSFGFSDNADYVVSKVQLFPTYATYVLCYKKICFFNITLGITGLHNILNATAAFALAHQLNIPPENIVKKLATFSGVERRFDYQIERKDFIFIDDYAHHPEELKSLFLTLKTIYPDRPFTVIFQPHLYSRTRDFFQEFAEVLAIPDNIILLEIYFAREKPIEGISSATLLSLIKNENKILLQKEELIPYLQKNRPTLLVTAGAGDISQCVPLIKKTFSNS